MKRNTWAKVASQQNLSGKQLKRPQMKFSKSLLKIMSGFVLCDYLCGFNRDIPDRVRHMTRILHTTRISSVESVIFVDICWTKKNLWVPIRNRTSDLRIQACFERIIFIFARTVNVNFSGSRVWFSVLFEGFPIHTNRFDRRKHAFHWKIGSLSVKLERCYRKG